MSLLRDTILAVAICVFDSCFLSSMYCHCLHIRKVLRSLLVYTLGLLSWSTLLAQSMQFQPVFQSSSEVKVDRRVLRWSRTCSLLGLIDGLEVLEEPTYRKLVFWLTREAVVNGGGSLNFGGHRTYYFYKH